MTESGKVIQFKGSVIHPDGTRIEQTVIRVGSFNLISQSEYLNYQGETGQLLTLPRQPQNKYLSMASEVQSITSGYTSFGLDPSRGAILSKLIQAPSLGERLQQGGIVGYVIMTILFIGILIVLERIFTLQKETAKVKQQLKSEAIKEDNFLGRLIKVFKENKNKDLQTLELKMDESIVKSLPKIERGISTIKILAAIAPLMGLLGTVTGMIATFQSITLFGTGDPKLMAGGISTALVTTVLGLVCAIPLLLMHNFVATKSKGLIHILEEQCAGLIALKAEEEAI